MTARNGHGPNRDLSRCGSLRDTLLGYAVGVTAAVTDRPAAARATITGRVREALPPRHELALYSCAAVLAVALGAIIGNCGA